MVIDELHAFAGDDRGWHVLALLERIRNLSGREAQRIGLSATVGAPIALLDWLAGHCDGKQTLVHIPSPSQDAHLKIDFVASIENAATMISQLHRGEKRLVFADSRSRVEELALALRAKGVNVHVSHAALSADSKKQAEQAFAEGQNCVIVATSTLELGLDVGDLDRVIQIDAPGSVASFLQRMGRTGRREGAVRNMLFLATHDNGLLEATAITSLYKQNYVEPVSAPPAPFHILVQQLFAMLFERHLELDEADFEKILSRVPEFRSCFSNEWRDVIEFLESERFLIRQGHMLQLGPAGEYRFHGKRLADLCVSFDAPRTYATFLGNKHLGNIDPSALKNSGDRATVLALGGRSWRVVSIDNSRDRVYVESAQEKGRSRWIGESRGLPRRLASEIHQVLSHAKPELDDTLTKRATTRLEQLREELSYTLTNAPLRNLDGSYEWWTYAGSAFNILLATSVEALGGRCRTTNSYSVKFTLPEEHLPRLRERDVRSESAAATPSTILLTLKFQDLLPNFLVSSIWRDRVFSESQRDEREVK